MQLPDAAQKTLQNILVANHRAESYALILGSPQGQHRGTLSRGESADAFRQKYALYQNGLANIVDFTQALYVLNRAEVDSYITSNNVWQALLYKAAATGDFGIFINNF